MIFMLATSTLTLVFAVHWRIEAPQYFTASAVITFILGGLHCVVTMTASSDRSHAEFRRAALMKRYDGLSTMILYVLCHQNANGFQRRRNHCHCFGCASSGRQGGQGWYKLDRRVPYWLGNCSSNHVQLVWIDDYEVQQATINEGRARDFMEATPNCTPGDHTFRAGAACSKFTPLSAITDQRISSTLERLQGPWRNMTESSTPRSGTQAPSLKRSTSTLFSMLSKSILPSTAS